MPQQIAKTGRILVLTAQAGQDAAIVTQLAQCGHAVTTANSVAQALQRAVIQPPDLILLDLPIPGIANVEQLATLHEPPGLRKIPVIVLASAPDRQRLLPAFEAGAVDCIRKPCEPDEVLARVQVHLRLKLTRDRLEHVARERQELVNLVAHDLKNPLTSVLFAREMLALPDANPERAPRYLQIIEESTREALGYIRSYLESHAHPAQADAVAAPSCAHQSDTQQWLASRYELQLEASGMRLYIDAPNVDACVAINGRVLRQVSENLVSNALKYACAGGELALAARPGTPGYWQLVVQDRGPGIPASFLPRLFMPFQREHAGDAAAPFSNGLGLTLAQQIATSAGGRLWHEDREGGGARFLLELPEGGCHDHCP